MSDRRAEVRAQLAQRLAEQAIAEFTEECEFLFDGRSPIEILMGTALSYLLRHNEAWGGAGYNTIEMWTHSIEAIKLRGPRESGLTVWLEMKIDQYRADFFVDFRLGPTRSAQAVIECDGHEFHEKTKAQVARDKARDRYFQSLGYLVLRYPGSEIYRNPLKCATDALTIIEGAAKRSAKLA